MKKIAVFASGNGSNFQAILDTIATESWDFEVAVLITDKPNCFAIQRAKKHNVPVFAFDPKNYTTKDNFEKEIAQLLKEEEVSLLVLAGYMRLIGNVLLSAYPNQIINIHPALLPAFPGKDGIKQAFNYGVKVFGVTVHIVDAGMDTGQILAQESFQISDDDTLETIENKIHNIEHQLYPQIIKKLCASLR